MGIIVTDMLYLIARDIKSDDDEQENFGFPEGKDHIVIRIAYYAAIFVILICVIISYKLYKNAIYVAIFLEIFGCIFFMYRAREFFENSENTKAELISLVMSSYYIGLSKVFILMLLFNLLMFTNKRLLYLINLVVAIISLISFFYGIFGFNPPADEFKLMIFVAILICLSLPAVFYIVVKMTMLNYTQALEVNKIL